MFDQKHVSTNPQCLGNLEFNNKKVILSDTSSSYHCHPDFEFHCEMLSSIVMLRCLSKCNQLSHGITQRIGSEQRARSVAPSVLAPYALTM